MDFPPEVIEHIRAGNKIEAVKALRAASDMDIAAAIQIVDKAAASPAIRRTNCYASRLSARLAPLIPQYGVAGCVMYNG